jgi:hypothetical protein
MKATTRRISPRTMSAAGLILSFVVSTALESCSAKTMTKPRVMLVMKAPSR